MNIFVEALETVYRLVTFQTCFEDMGRRDEPRRSSLPTERSGPRWRPSEKRRRIRSAG